MEINLESQKKAALISIIISSYMVPFMGSAINIALPLIGHEFSIDALMLNWIATSYLLSSAVFLLPCGKLADMYGRKKIFTLGMFIFTLASLLIIFSGNISIFLFLRVVQGIGSSMVFGTGIAILTSIYPVNERGKVIGITISSVYIGLSTGPFLGGLLAQQFGWKSIFLLMVPFGLVALTFVITKLKGEWADSKKEPFDFLGTLIYSLSLVAMMYGFSLLPSLSAIFLIIFALAGMYLFTLWEKKVLSPLLNLNLFKNNNSFTFSNIAALINYSATFGVGFLLSLYLQYIKGYTPRHAGLILIAQPIVMAICSPLSGRLSDKIEPRLVATIGMALSTLGLIPFIFINQTFSIPVIIISLMVLGLGFGLFSSPNTNAVMSSVEKKFFGVASATLSTMRLTGQMFSMGITMVIFAVIMGRTKITPEVHESFIQSMKIIFIIFVILCSFGVFASSKRGNIRPAT